MGELSIQFPLTIVPFVDMGSSPDPYFWNCFASICLVYILNIALSKIDPDSLLGVRTKLLLSLYTEQKKAIRNKSNGILPKLTAYMKDVRRLSKAIVLLQMKIF